MSMSDDGANLPQDPKSIEIVGLVPVVRASLFGNEAGTAIYVPYAQGYQSTVNFHVRTVANTSAAALALIDTVRREVRTGAPGVPVFNIRTFRRHIESSFDLWATRLGATMFSVFGGLALVLAVVGLYGVKAYSVARRTREIGIRMALGAEPGTVQTMILREGLVMTLTGAALGLLLALGLGRLCASLLYHVSPVDPVSFVLAPAVLLLTAMVACYVPARKATRVNPLTALRSE
jgi:ABC-type antimicrobial peptide transport system permease subunit